MMQIQKQTGLLLNFVKVRHIEIYDLQKETMFYKPSV